MKNNHEGIQQIWNVGALKSVKERAASKGLNVCGMEGGEEDCNGVRSKWFVTVIVDQTTAKTFSAIHCSDVYNQVKDFVDNYTGDLK